MALTATLGSVAVAARTEKGRRDENQDAMTGFPSPFGTVYLVADGMGGNVGGAEASAMVAQCYRKYLTSLPATLPLAEALQRATSATNAEVRLRSQSGDPAVANMGSTVVMVVLRETPLGLEGAVAHVGDSRAYLLRQGQLARLTRDHSAVQRLVDSQQLTPEEARLHPDSNVITRALGQQNELLIEVSEERFETGDLILLCSDGLSGYVPDQGIASALVQVRDLERAADGLIALALESGSSDNITVQLLRLDAASANGARALAPPPLPPRLAPAMPVASGTETPVAPNAGLASPLKLAGAGLLGLLLGSLGTGVIVGAKVQVMKQAPFVQVARPCPAPIEDVTPSGPVVNPAGVTTQPPAKAQTQPEKAQQPDKSQQPGKKPSAAVIPHPKPAQSTPPAQRPEGQTPPPPEPTPSEQATASTNQLTPQL
jgi:protein phosphatase